MEGEKGLFVNLYLPKENGDTAEVDLVMTHRTGIYVFESKNYSGWIFGNENQRYWTQTLKGNHKNRFYNPVWQNNGHIAVLKNVLGVDEDLVESFIVFSKRCTLKKVEVNTARVHVMKRNWLKEELQQVMNGKNNKLSVQELAQMNQKLKPYMNASNQVKEAHVKRIASKEDAS